MFSTLIAMVLALMMMFVPGILVALALLKKTGMNIFEISVIGFIFGFLGPASMTWLEAYMMNYIHFFSYSLTLFIINAAVLTVLGLALCMWQGVFRGFRNEFLPKKEKLTLAHTWVWLALFVLMLFTFMTRMESLGAAPTFFEFDPYFDMVDAQYILTYGQQLLLDPSAWPQTPQGTNHRIEPLIPYVEAYWYGMVNAFSYHYATFNTTLMSRVGGTYPPIVAALLVFSVFILLYKEYNEYIGLLAAALTSAMPVLFSTFIAGEQLVEPWGIFALFFFFAMYMLAVKNMKSKRLAVLAGLAFVANFLGAHYYTVTTGVFVIYMLLQGMVDIARGEMAVDFYRMNGIIIAVIAVFYAVYLPYSSTLQNRIPTVLGVPLTLSGPIVALLLVALMDYAPRMLAERKMFVRGADMKTRLAWMGVVVVIGLLAVLFTPLGSPIKGYLTLSTKFTTPSSPLFMTVEEFIPTGIAYNFGAQGFGIIGADIFGLPLTIWLVSAAALALIAVSIYYRRSRIGILYAAIALPLMFAGFSEVKYLPHFGIAYIMLFAILLGELVYHTENGFRLREVRSEAAAERLEQDELIPPEAKSYGRQSYLITVILSFGLFFFSSVLALIYLAYTAFTEKHKGQNAYIWGAFVAFVVVVVLYLVFNHSMMYGESYTYIDAAGAWLIAGGAPSSQAACSSMAQAGYSTGYTMYCNTIPAYWLNAMAWIRNNVGPNAPRVLSWWDYGDWINWFGHSNAVIRGDNANALEDYATAAQFVLGANDSVSPQSLATFMDIEQTKYLLFDQDLISKWQALDFLACIHANETTQAFAAAQGASQTPPVPYVLGNSQCEQSHDPAYALVPYAALVQNQSASLQQSISYYCSVSNSTTLFASVVLTVGSSLLNQSLCVDTTPNQQGVLRLYDSSGKRVNAVLQASTAGITYYQGVPFVQFFVLYLPNGPNGTITNAPSRFYASNFYKGFILGSLPGFHQVYPASSNGINMVNASYAVKIFALNNFTGQLPPVPPKPPWIQNNYTMQ